MINAYPYGPGPRYRVTHVKGAGFEFFEVRDVRDSGMVVGRHRMAFQAERDAAALNESADGIRIAATREDGFADRLTRVAHAISELCDFWQAEGIAGDFPNEFGDWPFRGSLDEAGAELERIAEAIRAETNGRA